MNPISIVNRISSWVPAQSISRPLLTHTSYLKPAAHPLNHLVKANFHSNVVFQSQYTRILSPTSIATPSLPRRHLPQCFDAHTRPYSKAQDSNGNLSNEQIRARTVRVIDNDGKQLGVYPTEEAIRLARAQQLDLVVIDGKCTPIVCRICQYQKFMYEKKKKLKATRNITKAKDLVLGPKIQVLMSTEAC